MTIRTLQPPAIPVKLPAPRRWTYKDYCRLPEDGWRYEVIQGRLYMTPAPRTPHQRTQMILSSSLHQFVTARNLGEVFPAPIDVILPGLAEPVQPDIIFIGRKRLKIIKEKYVKGAPDLLVEILSPTSWHADRNVKFEVYAKAGVKEYWIIDAEKREVEIYRLEKDRTYSLTRRYGAGETASSNLLKGFKAAVSQLCP
ncbi:MAG: Uma2 family endonuclease [Planctomycetes bacterium]|nr:Uma2 family endonuclease [Planctomycetota bacterium]